MFAILNSLIKVYTTCHSQQSDQGQGLHCHSKEQSDQGLHYMPVSAFWSGSSLFAIHNLIRVFTICLSQYDQGQHHLPFSAIWSSSTLSFSAVWSVSTVFLSRLITVKVHCHSRSRSTLFAIFSSQIRVYTICHSQQSDQCLHYLQFFISSIIKVYTVWHSQSDQRLNYLPFSAVWLGSTLYAIISKQYYQGLHCFVMLSNLNRVYTTCRSQQSDQGQRLHCHSQEQSDQGLHYLPFSAVWSWSTLFDILHSSLIRIYTVCHSQQSDHGLHYWPFSAVWSRSRSTLSFSRTVWSGSTQFPILSSLMKVYTVCHSQQSDQGLHYLPFSASHQGLHCLPFSAACLG